MTPKVSALLLATGAMLGILAPSNAAQTPTATAQNVLPTADVPVYSVPALDMVKVQAEDERRESEGLAPRFAVPNQVFLTPDNAGLWETVDEKTLLWRLRVQAPNAGSINLGFSQYFMPEGGQLLLYTTDMKTVVGPFTSEDNESHGELWTPVVLTDDLVVEVTIPNQGVGVLALGMTQVGSGYRGFGLGRGPQKSGSCNVDVVCPEGNGWEDEIQSVGVISTGGSTFCTGFMVNNTANDRTPYFMTADHCGIGSGNAASLVVYWNYETSVCGGTPDGLLNQFQTGSFFRAANSSTDFTLVELDSDPLDAWDVTFAGWDRTGVNATTAIAIHHPNTDEKRISFEYAGTTTTSYLGSSVPGDGTHVRVLDWDVGTTEPGSSGSPLFDQNHRVIGQLHGGYAACGNDDEDWYGKFAISWGTGGSASTRLSDWLDPGNTGATVLDTLGKGLSVSSSGSVTHEGNVTGPFTNPVIAHTLTNQTAASLSYKVSLTGSLGLLINGGTADITGSLAPGATTNVTVTLGPAISMLGVGVYSQDVLFEDLTNVSTTTSTHNFIIGKTLAYEVNMDTDPGWTTQGQWAWGTPTGGGGTAHGGPDPTSGATGSNVYGYNLSGDYPNNLTEQHLISTPIDCSSLEGTEVKFMRWLNVEQPLYDHAKFSVSNNGISYTTIWENSGEIADSSWSEQSYDISAIADGQSTVYLRWTMGSTDSSWQYSGWNIDDVKIEGVGGFTPYGVGCQGTGGLVPNLFGTGNTSPGGAINVTVNNGLPGAPALLYLGLTPNSSPVNGCTVLVGSILGPPLVLSLNGSGALSIPTFVPPTWPIGTELYIQYLIKDTGAANGKWALSNGLELLVQ